MNEPLPGLLGEIEEVAGRAVALKIAAAYGGTRISIPTKVGPDSWLWKCVGQADAQRICEYFAILGTFGNRRVSSVRHEVIPMVGLTLHGAAQREALEKLQNGQSPRTVARNLRVHERSVYRWRKKFIAEGLLELPGRDRRNSR